MMKNSLLIFLIAPFILFGCSGGGGGDGAIITKAAPFCTTISSYPSGYTITGSADYQFRTNGNGVVDATTNPIRHAEIFVSDSSGTIVQCGATDNTGNFSLVVPDSSETYTVKVSSRIIHGMTQAYVLNNPSDKAHHFISTTFVADENKSIGNLRASATGTLEGGAFNILDKILAANEYLETETDDCSSSFPTCIPFTQTPLVMVYWTAGLNPGTYFNAGPVSFYLPSQKELYILGGVSGDVNNSDADHFDNSIILHEYGHFIEDTFSKTNSPGGSHSGNTILDARLSWGEGWANFLQAAVLDDPIYRDTSGNTSGTTMIFFNEDLETPNNDIPSAMGEGIFREFSVARALWDALDTPAEVGVDAVDSDFNELWTVFAGTTGFSSASVHFRNMGLFHQIQQSLVGASDWSSIRTGEKQLGNQNEYARPTTGPGCGSTAITPANISGGQPENGSLSNSNQFSSNDFYQVSHPGGAFSLQLDYAPANMNLDLYVFQQGYNFVRASGIVGQSISTGIGTTELVSMALAAGVYIINVRAKTTGGSGVGNTSNYNMTLNGAALCPN